MNKQHWSDVECRIRIKLPEFNVNVTGCELTVVSGTFQNTTAPSLQYKIADLISYYVESDA